VVCACMCDVRLCGVFVCRVVCAVCVCEKERGVWCFVLVMRCVVCVLAVCVGKVCDVCACSVCLVRCVRCVRCFSGVRVYV
jgi:hypothetical protein